MVFHFQLNFHAFSYFLFFLKNFFSSSLDFFQLSQSLETKFHIFIPRTAEQKLSVTNIFFSIFISFLIIVVDEYLASADSYESVFLATFLVSYIGMPSSASGKKNSSLNDKPERTKTVQFSLDKLTCAQWSGGGYKICELFVTITDIAILLLKLAKLLQLKPHPFICM